MPLDLNADITGLRGADYNPRRIDPEDLDTLAESLRTIGLVKPLIVRNDLLVAGHQRTKALRRLGIERAAVYRLPVDTTVYDEIRFNQMHNGTDLDGGDEDVRITAGFDTPGWHVVKAGQFTGNTRAQMAPVRATICELIVRYGPWGGVVATMDGRVIHAAQYALAALATRTPLTVCVIPPEQEEAAQRFLGRTYGVFSYDHLERQTYIQTLAQMCRLRGGPSGKENRSTLYEQHVAPWLAANPAARAIDFGAGHGDYAAAMRGRGFDVHDVELFRRSKAMVLDTKAIHGMISRMCEDLSGKGPYDVVICDSVLNSVDCLAAETAVMTVLNMLARPGGTVFFSGRPMEQHAKIERYTKSVSRQQRRYIEFLDEHGFTALYRQGRWFYQKFHSKDQVADLAERHGFAVEKIVTGNNSWQAIARKVRDLPAEQVEAACDYEFNLALGDDLRLNRHEDVKRAYRAATTGRLAAA